MPTTLGVTDVCNVALSKIGAQPINSITDQTNRSAIICNTNFSLAYLQASRSGRWNCLLTTAQLVQEVQTPISGTNPPITAVPWAPSTLYLANTYVSFGGYFYLVTFTYTSSTVFLNDVTDGALAQTDQQTNSPFTDLQLDTFGCLGSQFPSGWGFQYALPSDFQLLGMLNGNICWDFDGGGGQGSEYEIMGPSLFCNSPLAVIQYVKNQPDTTQFDAMFMSAITFLLASMISTPLRQDGGKMESEMLAAYTRALSSARAKNGGEQKPRRFSPIPSSRLLRSRYAWWGGSGTAQ